MGIDVEHYIYIKLGLDHLLDPSTYKLLTKDQANQDIHDLKLAIYDWTVCHYPSLPDNIVNFSQEHMKKASKDPLGYFYLLIKLYKLPIVGHLVCSDCGSLPHALGCYVDARLQPIVKDQALYFKNLAELKSDLEGAVAMYPSINTADCMA